MEQQGLEAGMQPGCCASRLPVLSPFLLSSAAAHADLPLQRGLSTRLPADKQVGHLQSFLGITDYLLMEQISSSRCEGQSESHQRRNSTPGIWQQELVEQMHGGQETWP